MEAPGRVGRGAAPTGAPQPSPRSPALRPEPRVACAFAVTSAGGDVHRSLCRNAENFPQTRVTSGAHSSTYFAATVSRVQQRPRGGARGRVRAHAPAVPMNFLRAPHPHHRGAARTCSEEHASLWPRGPEDEPGEGEPGTAPRGAWGLHLGVHRQRGAAHSKRNSPPFLSGFGEAACTPAADGASSPRKNSAAPAQRTEGDSPDVLARPCGPLHTRAGGHCCGRTADAPGRQRHRPWSVGGPPRPVAQTSPEGGGRWPAPPQTASRPSRVMSGHMSRRHRGRTRTRAPPPLAPRGACP